ncbi:MAG: hypothetical protein ACOC9W_00660 [Persicimonas sp.]
MADLGSIESIESLAKDMRVEDGLFFVNFETPDDGESVPAVVAVESSNTPTAGAETSPEEPFYFSLIRSANGLARDILGYNATVLGTTTAIDSKLDEAKEDAEASDKPQKQSLEELTDEEREDALFRAFEQVMHRFAWDPTTDQWVIVHEARGLGSELQRQLKLAPLETKADREVLTQMALEVASADGKIDRTEQEVLLDFVDRDKVVQGPSTARAGPTFPIFRCLASWSRLFLCSCCGSWTSSRSTRGLRSSSRDARRVASISSCAAPRWSPVTSTTARCSSWPRWGRASFSVNLPC